MQKDHQVRSGENQCQCAACQNKRSSGIALPAVAPFQMVMDNSLIQMKNGVPVNDDKGLEHEAEVMGEKAGQLQSGPAVQRFGSPVSIASPVVQRYQPTSKDKDKKFKVKKKASDPHFITATYKRNDIYGWYFEDGDGNEFLVQNQRNIKQEGEEIKKEGDKGKSRSYYDPLAFSSKCQFPGCDEDSFEDPQDLNDHIKSTHPFPKAKEYPYALFGGQSALSHSLIKVGQGFKPLSSKTGEGFHSEWRRFDDRIPEKKPEKRKAEEEEKPTKENKRPPKKKKTEDTREKKKEEQHSSGLSFTTDLDELMDTGSTTEGMYVTGDPHCALCTLTLNKAGLPVTYPTNAKPATSPMYNVPASAPNFKEILKKFPKEPDHTHKTHSTFEKTNFPKIESRQSYNDRLRQAYKKPKDKDDGEQRIKYMLQAINVNRESYNEFFNGLEEGELYSRDELKEELNEHPIPQHPYTFTPYCPSPVRNKEKEEQERKVLSERQLKKIISAIDKAFKKYDPEKIEVRKRYEKHIDPVKENNCLITALNGGKNASYENVLMIRYLIFEQLGIGYGQYLPASPEVIYIIAKTLQISNTRIEIFRDEENAEQIFIIASNYNIIELEGDEEDSQQGADVEHIIVIDHSGGNHFSYRKPKKAKKPKKKNNNK